MKKKEWVEEFKAAITKAIKETVKPILCAEEWEQFDFLSVDLKEDPKTKKFAEWVLEQYLIETGIVEIKL